MSNLTWSAYLFAITPLPVLGSYIICGLKSFSSAHSFLGFSPRSFLEIAIAACCAGDTASPLAFLKSCAVGAPFSPGFLIFSPRFLLLCMFLHKDSLVCLVAAISSFSCSISLLCFAFKSASSFALSTASSFFILPLPATFIVRLTSCGNLSLSILFLFIGLTLSYTDAIILAVVKSSFIPSMFIMPFFLTT